MERLVRRQRQRLNESCVAEDVWIGSHFDVAMDQAGSWTGSTKSQGLYISCDGRRTGIVDPVSRLESPAHLSWKVGTIRWKELQRSERTIFNEPTSINPNEPVNMSTEWHARAEVKLRARDHGNEHKSMERRLFEERVVWAVANHRYYESVLVNLYLKHLQRMSQIIINIKYQLI